MKLHLEKSISEREQSVVQVINIYTQFNSEANHQLYSKGHANSNRIILLHAYRTAEQKSPCGLRYMWFCKKI